MDSDTPIGPGPAASAPPALPAAAAAPPRISPPPAPRRGRTLWIVLLVVVALVVMAALAVSMLIQAVGSLSLGGGPRGSSGPTLQEVVVEDNRSRNKIAMVDLTGIITSTAWDRSGYNLVRLVRDQLRMAGEDDRVHAVLLTIDSPGGEVLASDEIARAIGDFQERYGKVVVASMQSLAASGGYYTAVPCRWIVAHELTLTGSIGVLMQGYNYRGLMDKLGVRPEVFKSGRFKDMLRGDKLEHEITAEEREMAQALVDETFARFKQVVRSGRQAAARVNGERGRALADNWEEYADGRILTGQQAYEVGFVDELGNQETALERARQLSGITHANLIRYQRQLDFGSLFRLLGRTEPATVKVDLGFEVPPLEAGRLYFLAPSPFH